MRRGFPYLLLFLALAGFVLRPGAVTAHAHEGGDETHHHVVGDRMLAQVAPHAHPHTDEDPASESDTETGAPVDRPQSPEDEREHAHVEDGPDAAPRLRNDRSERDASSLSGVLPPFVVVVWSLGPVAAPQLPPERWHGYSPFRSLRTVERLIQGIGLLI